jgi:uncharacterized membrane-anchored protein YitT (DUF2179 family)
LNFKNKRLIANLISFLIFITLIIVIYAVFGHDNKYLNNMFYTIPAVIIYGIISNVLINKIAGPATNNRSK